MIEFREDAELGLSYGFAGDTLNVATYLRRLLPSSEYRVDYVTALGHDLMSRRMLEAWRAEGIGTDLVHQIEGALPGLYWIQNRPDGERDFLYWRSASAARQMFHGHRPPLEAALGQGDLLYLSGISLAILPPAHREVLLEAIATLRQEGVRIAYDSNYRARLWAGPEEAKAARHRVLPNVDLFIASFPDESALFGDRELQETADRLAGYDVPEWVLRGEPGTTITSDGGLISAAPVASAAVRDTTGAGDSFDAAYIAARMLGCDSAAAVRAGHALAGVVVQHRGAIIPADSTPTMPELMAGE